MFRIVTYNIKGAERSSAAQIAEVLAAIDGDVVVLEEVPDPGIVVSLADALGMQGFFARSNLTRHLALLSRLNVAARSYRPYPPIRATVLEATVTTAQGQLVNIFGVHLLPHPGTILDWWRVWEVQVVLRRMRRHAEQPCVLVGDFNAVAPGESLDPGGGSRLSRTLLKLQGGRIVTRAIQSVLDAGLIDCYRTLHPHRPGLTLPTPTPRLRVDYVFANAILAPHLRRCTAVTDPGVMRRASDHYPLVAEFDV